MRGPMDKKKKVNRSAIWCIDSRALIYLSALKHLQGQEEEGVLLELSAGSLAIGLV